MGIIVACRRLFTNLFAALLLHKPLLHTQALSSAHCADVLSCYRSVLQLLLTNCLQTVIYHVAMKRTSFDSESTVQKSTVIIA